MPQQFLSSRRLYTEGTRDAPPATGPQAPDGTARTGPQAHKSQGRTRTPQGVTTAHRQPENHTNAEPSSRREMLNISDAYKGSFVKGDWARCNCAMRTICYKKPNVFQMGSCMMCKDTYSTLEPKYDAEIVKAKAKSPLVPFRNPLGII